MPKENNKIVIIVGAGASADFLATQEKKLNENHGDIKFEIWENTQYHFDKNPDKNSRYFLSENNRKNYSFPSGEALIKMIGSPRKVFDIFGNVILDEIYKDFCKKVDWSLEGEDQNIIELKKNFLKYFFEFLKNPIYQNQQETNVNIFSFDKSIGHAIEKYVSEIGAITNDYCFFKNILKRIEKFNKNLEFYNFINIYNLYFGIREYKNETQDEIINLVTDFLEVTLRKNLKIEISKFEDLEYRVTNKINKKISTLFDDILKISTSRHLQISSLVNYYQPFSIDELLDSIKTKKIDVIEPLKIKSEDLKTILKSNEQDQKKLEEQFRNELIDAGKTLIALFLLRSEKKDLFDNSNPEINAKIWYRHIRNLIINSGKDAKEIKQQIQNLTIISFNYDRSLDYYLRTRLSDYYNEIKERIIYPYGKLADDDWSKEEQNWSKEKYGSFERDGFNPYNKDELEKIKKLGSGLRVIGELDQENKNSGNVNLKKAYNLLKNISDLEKYYKGIKKLKRFKNHENNPDIKTEINFILEKYQTLLALHESHKIYFLGFAFHQQNCDLMKLENFKDNKEIYWTNYDDSISINRKIENIFGVNEYNKKRFYPSIKKGVYDALIHDFKIEFE